MKQNETKPKKTKDSDYWFSLVNAPQISLGPPNHGGALPKGPQPLGTPKLCGHQPFGATEPANHGDPPPQLWGPQALGAPEPWEPLGQA
jgi:hypothetical protein